MKQHPSFRFPAICLAALLAACTGAAHAWPVDAPSDARAAPVASSADKPRASMEAMQIPSHGMLLNALTYVAAGAGRHPVVVLLHGFPGNERNLDLAQDMRHAGWDVVYFNYRGSWGTPGAFSFAHGIEDTASVLSYLRKPEVAKRLRLDPAHIVLVGHSMGGFMAVEAAAADPAIRAFATISAADMPGMYLQVQGRQGKDAALKAMAAGLANEGMAPLSGCTPDGLARELAGHAGDWPFLDKASALKDRTVFVVTSDDGLAAPNDAFAAALRKAGDTHVDSLHLSTDHAYSDRRRELSQALLKWLAGLPE